MNRRLVFAGFSLAMFLSTSAALAAVDPAVLKARQKFFGIDNVDAAIRDVGPFGLDVCSGVRTDGRLDDVKLHAFVQAMSARP